VAPAAGLSNFESISEVTNPYESPFTVTVKLCLYAARTEEQFSAFSAQEELSSRLICKF